MGIIRTKPHVYFWIAGVFFASGVVYYVLPRGDLIQQLSGVPLVGSLVGLLVKILLDESAHQRDIAKNAAQNNFTFAATSHMAAVAFDKHVEFSEAYAKGLLEALFELFRKGPTKDVRDQASKLSNLRHDYVVWLTKDIDSQLQKFEKALLELAMGASIVYDESIPPNAERQKVLEEMYRTFAKVANMKEWSGQQLTDELAVNTALQQLRTILGIETLVGLRMRIVENATKELATQP